MIDARALDHLVPIWALHLRFCRLLMDATVVSGGSHPGRTNSCTRLEYLTAAVILKKLESRWA